MQKLSNRWLHITAVLVTILLYSSLTRAQDVTGPALKAAYIFNLAKFTQWPEEVLYTKKFVMCVIGDQAVAEELERIVKNRSVAGNSITVTRAHADGEERLCHLLYVSEISAAKTAQLVGGLKGIPVLTISDIDGFIKVGGMVQLFYQQGQLRFGIGLESARNAHLEISSKILTIAMRKND